MRRLLPHLAAFFAALLLVQWAQGASACLATLRFDPAQIICHATDDPPGDARPHAELACPHCAPLPPALAAAPPALPPPARVAEAPPAPRLPAPPPRAAARAAAHQPRAPPAQA